MKQYVYNGPPDRQIKIGTLPAGDYDFVVSSHEEPYEKNDHMILPVKLSMVPSGRFVFAYPWSGYTASGELRDGIAEFLIAISRAPKVGEIPDWDSIDGAHGRCRLKVKIAEAGNLAGKEVNAVDYFFIPKELPREPAKGRAPKTEEEDDDLDMTPSAIPF